MQASIQNNFDFTAQANVDPREAQSHVSNGMTCSEPAHQLRVSNPNQGPPMKIIEESKTSNDEPNSTSIPDYEFGMRNDGNTCFMNAAMQCVFSCNEFIQYYKDKRYIDDRDTDGITMKLEGYQYSNAVSNICQDIVDHNNVISIWDLRKMLKDEFELGQQNDAMQLILYIFDKLQCEQTPKRTRFISRDYDCSKEAWEGYIQKFSSITDELFSGMYQKNIK